MTPKIALFASGSGSNAENIINYFSTKPEIDVALVVSNKSDAFVLQRAQRLGIPSVTFTATDFREGDSISNYLKENDISFIVLAGFLLKIPQSILTAYPNRILNIHPALLPNYGGKGMYGHHVHEAVIAAGEPESGITIHFVNEKYDDGKVVFQARCAVSRNDTADTLAQKIHQLEYLHFPPVIEQVINSTTK